MPVTTVHRELVAPNNTRNLARIRGAVHEAAAASALVDRDARQVVLAVDEAVANIIEHAYDGSVEPGDIRITIDATPARFEVVISDAGREFDPGAVEMPDIREHVRNRQKDGLGVFLMRQIMDEVKYTFVQGIRNELRLVKYIRAGGEGD
jgi:serine/threonine-protein kinase RsbW